MSLYFLGIQGMNHLQSNNRKLNTTKMYEVNRNGNNIQAKMRVFLLKKDPKTKPICFDILSETKSNLYIIIYYCIKQPQNDQ